MAEGAVLWRSLRSGSLLALGRTIPDRLNGSLFVVCAHCEPGWAMGASIVLRWRVSDLECELQINGAVAEASVRQDGKVVRRAIVASASAAHEWASEQIDILQRAQRRTG